jgi:hypothetical protein
MASFRVSTNVYSYIREMYRRRYWQWKGLDRLYWVALIPQSIYLTSSLLSLLTQHSERAGDVHAYILYTWPHRIF